MIPWRRAVASIADSLVVMLAVVLIKRELHNLDGRLSLGYDTRKGMEPTAGFAAPSEAVRGFNQGQFARTRLLWLRLFPRHAHRLVGVSSERLRPAVPREVGKNSTLKPVL
jgi:hypothetical protein